MAPAEVASLISFLAGCYPHMVVPPAMMEAWVLVLAGDDADQIKASAVRHIRAGSRFFPSIAELVKPVAETNSGTVDAETALGEVMAARIRAKVAIETRGTYSLRPWSSSAIGEAVEAMGGWDAVVEADHIPSLRAHFLRVYGQRRANRVEGEAMADVPETMRLKPRERAPALPEADRDPKNVAAERTLAGILAHVERGLTEDRAARPKVADLPQAEDDEASVKAREPGGEG